MTARLAAWARTRGPLFAISAYMGGRTIWDVIHRLPSDSVLSYWTFTIGPDTYADAPYTYAGHQYPPIIGQLLTPLTALDMREFMAVWAFLQLALLLSLVGPRWFGLALLMNPVQWAVWNGNVQLLYAVVAALGIRYPALWAIPILTKITPGIGLLWFAVRREWKHLAIALGVTVVLLAASVAKSPDVWADWLRFAQAGSATLETDAAVPVPLLPRLALCAVLVILGARRNWTWTLGAALWLAMPTAWWLGAFALLGSFRERLLGQDPVVVNEHLRRQVPRRAVLGPVGPQNEGRGGRDDGIDRDGVRRPSASAIG